MRGSVVQVEVLRGVFGGEPFEFQGLFDPGGQHPRGEEPVQHTQRRERIAGLAATRPAQARTALPQTRNTVVVPYGSRTPATT